MVRISRSRMDMEGGRIDQAVIRNYGETLVGGAAGTNTGSSYTIDLSGGNVFNLTLNANCTFTFSNSTASGTACSFVLYVTQGGSKTATWPASVLWQNNTTPTLTSTAGRVDIFSFMTVDAGATWLGFVVAQNFNLAGAAAEFWLPYGYFGAGETPSLVSTVDRIDYSNDTATAAVKGPLSLAVSDHGATGNSSFGYFGGGFNLSLCSIVDRIDYSNDTATAAVKGPLSLARFRSAATGTSSLGYFGGGTDGTFSATTTVDRIDYSNDTATAAVKGPLSLARGGSAATGTSSFGYVGGGYNSGNRSTVNRIDYSNDTAIAAVKGPLSAARYQLAATGTSSFGYFGGGIPVTATVDRIDYSNDTATAAVKGPLSLARFQFAATNHASGL